MYRYVSIGDDGIITGESWLTGEVEAENLILVDPDFDTANKRYIDGKWVDYPEPEPSEDEMEEWEQTQMEMAMNVEYLVMLAEMNNEMEV